VAILNADDTIASRINAAVRCSPPAAAVVGRMAAGLASLEVMLMLVLSLAGRRRAAATMLAAVGLVYLSSEGFGAAWPRQRPFARIKDVEALARHTPERSFPSRHVASGLAMAAIGRQAHPRLGASMAAVAWLLGISRVAAGLHYPTDVLAGAALGSAIGAVAQSPRRTRPRESIRIKPSSARPRITSGNAPTVRAASSVASDSPFGRSLRSWTSRPRL
jgi:membrane-associated phospholipid phosphatase